MNINLPSNSNEYCEWRGREGILNKIKHLLTFLSLKKCHKNLNPKIKNEEIIQICIEVIIENKTTVNKIIKFKNVPLELLLQIGYEGFSNEVIRKNLTSILIIEAKLVITYLNWIRMNSISRSTYLHIGTRLRMAFTSNQKMSI